MEPQADIIALLQHRSDEADGAVGRKDCSWLCSWSSPLRAPRFGCGTGVGRTGRQLLVLHGAVIVITLLAALTPVQGRMVLRGGGGRRAGGVTARVDGLMPQGEDEYSGGEWSKSEGVVGGWGSKEEDMPSMQVEILLLSVDPKHTQQTHRHTFRRVHPALP